MLAYLTAIALAAPLLGAPEVEADPFGAYTGTMVIYDQQEENYIILNEQRAAERFTPFSTHKIPHSLIALETGAVKDLDQILSWDSSRYPQEAWWPTTWEGEHTLGSAIDVSLVPAYRQLAHDMGPDTMRKYLKQFSYGNTDISSGIDNYWLNGSLKISAMEQVNFLRKFYNSQLGVTDRSTQLTKEILVREKTDSSVFSYKTGTGTVDPETGNALAWLTGYVEQADRVYFFAMNIQGRTFAEIIQPRMLIARQILESFHILGGQ